MNFKTSLKRAKGLGSAKEGTKHWLAQRVSAVALIILVIWMISAFLQFPVADIYGGGLSLLKTREIAMEWISHPLNSLLCIFLLIAMFYHGALGMRVILEDYVHNELTKVLSIIAVNILSFAAAVIGIFSVLSSFLNG